MPTWADEIKRAQEGVALAYAQRNTIFRAANDAGLSMRQIAEAAGLSAMGVHKAIRSTDADVPVVARLDTSVQCDGSGGFGPPRDSGLLGWRACPGCPACERSLPSTAKEPRG